jgi:hypothetical protein
LIDQSRSTTSASATSLSSGFPATCPTDDQKTITDTNGISYQLRCSSDISSSNGGPESGFGASNNFNDCILQCDTYILPGNNIPCSGFAYVGGVNGVGAGTCYLKGGAPYNVVAASNTVVAALRLAATSTASSSTVQATTTTTSTTRTTTTSTTQTTTTSTTQTTTTSTTLTTTTTTSSSSSSSSAAASPLSTYSCPANDGQVVTDNGIQYQQRCGFQAQPVSGAGNYAIQTGQASLNVCLRSCSANTVEDRNNPGTFPICTGFTFSAGSDGTGSCTFRSQNPLTFGSPNAQFVGLVKVQYYQAPAVTTTSTTVTTTTTTTTSSSPTTVLNPTPSYTCPDYDQEARAFGGRTYIMGCSSILYPTTAFAQQPAPNNWNDCFGLCNALSGCTGFWYSSGVNGVGPGTCSFSNSARSGFVTTNNTNVAGTLYNSPDQFAGNIVITTTTTSTTSSSLASSVRTLTFTTVSYATVTTTSSYPVTTTAVSTQVQTVTTSYPVTTTQVSTAPGKFGTLRWPESKVL